MLLPQNVPAGSIVNCFFNECNSIKQILFSCLYDNMQPLPGDTQLSLALRLEYKRYSKLNSIQRQEGNLSDWPGIVWHLTL